MGRPSFEEIGSQQSLFGTRFVGFMRWLGGAAAAGAVLTGAGVALAAIEAKFPTTRRFDVRVPARPGMKELKILHLSDLHMFPGQGFIRDYLANVARTEDFDMVVSTGDNLGAREGIPLLLDALEPLLGTPGAFVLGSNDYYSPGFKPWASYLLPEGSEGRVDHRAEGAPDLPWLETVAAMTDAGWLDLTNQTGALEVPTLKGSQKVSLIGVDDPHIKRDRMPRPGSTWEDEAALRLALTHAPYRRILNAFSDYGADLVLAGHTHGGQVRLPGFGAIVTNTDISRKYSRGLMRWEGPGNDQMNLHVSAGLGTSPYAPVRFFCRPEVSLLRVCPTV